MKIKTRNEKRCTGKKTNYMKKFSEDESAIELPINIVVMLVVGMVALAMLLSMIPKSKESMTVDITNVRIDDGALQEGRAATVRGPGEYEVKVNATVFDKNNNPVEKASVTISGGGGFGVDQTNSYGEARVLVGGSGISNVTVRPNQKSVELKLVAKANGFYDYEDDTAVILYQK